MSRATFLLFVVALVTLVGCSRPEVPDTPNVLVLGTRGMIPLLDDLAERFREKRSDVRIDVEPAQADRAVADTRAGLADVGLISRALRPEETGLRGHVLGRDGVAFVVNASNNVPAPLEPHLVGILTRVYTNWRDVGGSDRPIVLIGGGEGHTIRETLIDYFGLRQPQLRPEPAIGSSAKVLETVASQPNAVGYVSLASVETFGNKQAIRLLPFHGITPSIENVRNRSYPLIRTLTLLYREPAHDHAKEFIDFVLSEQCYDLLDKHGFIPGSS